MTVVVVSLGLSSSHKNKSEEKKPCRKASPAARPNIALVRLIQIRTNDAFLFLFLTRWEILARTAAGTGSIARHNDFGIEVNHGKQLFHPCNLTY